MKYPVLNKNTAVENYKKRIYKKFSYDEFCIYHLEKVATKVNNQTYSFYKSSLEKNISNKEIIIAVNGFNFKEFYYANCLVNYFREKKVQCSILDLSNLSSSFIRFLKKQKTFKNSSYVKYPFLEIKKDLNSRFNFIKEISRFLKNPLIDIPPDCTIISFSSLLSTAFVELDFKKVNNIVYQYSDLEFSLCLTCPNLFLSSDVMIESSFLGMDDKNFESLKTIDNKSYLGDLISPQSQKTFLKNLKEKSENPIFNVVVHLSKIKSIKEKQYVTFLIENFKKNGNINLFFISENKKDFKYISKHLTYKYNSEYFDCDIERFLSGAEEKDHCIEFIYNEKHFYTALAIEKLLSKTDLYVCDKKTYIDLPLIKMVFTNNHVFQSKISASAFLKDFLFIQNMFELSFLFNKLVDKKDNLYKNLMNQVQHKFENNHFTATEKIANLLKIK